MERVLHGIRVLDFGRFIAGPFGSMLLADMGAEVIRIERPGGEEDRYIGVLSDTGESMGFMNMSRNKKGISLDVLSSKGREILRELVKKSDVLMGNFPYGVPEKMGIDYASLKKINPGIVVSIASGFGQEGPYAERPGFDMIAQAMSGAMTLTGFPGNPPTKAAVNYCDYATAMFAALGVMFALFHRERTGEGQMVDVSLFHTGVTFMMSPINEFMTKAILRPPYGNAGYWSVSDTFQTRDGWIIIAPISNNIWNRLLRVIGREDLKDDPRFKMDQDRTDHWNLLQPIIADWMKVRSSQAALELLDKGRVPAGPVMKYSEVPDNPHVKECNLIIPVEYPGAGPIPLIATPVRLSKTPGSIRNRAPLLGEHNEEIYTGFLGYKPEEIEEWKREGII
ncbi:MAG: CoA transferase [Candidatus Tectomicrobia bacterium]|uniref:CoA transferase n=1 Tax=Tectimicrobiota bacterium TaxID=2528274 RepID=A0A933GMA6_UNCTE|nr:CoA transferase [Candidatus Tectomicrobia bacterium]